MRSSNNRVDMAGQPFISAKNLTKRYGDTAVVDAVSFTIERGTITAIIGPNGAGKSTLARMLMGLIEPNLGTVRIAGNPPRTVRTMIGYVPQRFTFNPRVPLTLGEFLMLSLHVSGKHDKERDDIIADRLREVGLTGVMDKQLRDLSGGQLQRALIARAILTDKELLILDEPVAGVDIEGRRSIQELLKELNEKRGATIILISHELDVVFRYASSVLCINRRLLCHGQPQETLTQEVLGEMYGLRHGAHYHHDCVHSD